VPTDTTQPMETEQYPLPELFDVVPTDTTQPMETETHPLPELFDVVPTDTTQPMETEQYPLPELFDVVPSPPNDDDGGSWGDHKDKKEEEDGNRAPVSTTGTKKRRLCQSESVSDDGPLKKRPRKDNADAFTFTQPKQDPATGTSTNTLAAPSHSSITDDDDDSWNQDNDDATVVDDGADISRLGSYTITSGKYAGQQCIIEKHLPRRVRIQLVHSGLVTCISRLSLGLDEEKTVWHEEPRRSPRGHEQPRRSARIKAMVEASRSDVV